MQGTTGLGYIARRTRDQERLRRKGHGIFVAGKCWLRCCMKVWGTNIVPIALNATMCECWSAPQRLLWKKG